MTSEIRWKREIALGGVLLLTGLVGLPLAIYLVGQRVFGEYAPGQGVIDLLGAIWAEVASLNPAAWLLGLSPYLVITLLRLSRATWRPRAATLGSPTDEPDRLR